MVAECDSGRVIPVKSTQCESFLAPVESKWCCRLSPDRVHMVQGASFRRFSIFTVFLPSTAR